MSFSVKPINALFHEQQTEAVGNYMFDVNWCQTAV